MEEKLKCTEYGCYAELEIEERIFIPLPFQTQKRENGLAIVEAFILKCPRCRVKYFNFPELAGFKKLLM